MLLGSLLGQVACEPLPAPPAAGPDDEGLLRWDFGREAAVGPDAAAFAPQAAWPGLTFVHTPPLTLDDEGRVSVSLHLPEGARSFQLTLLGPEGVVVVPTRVEGPQGEVWVDDKAGDAAPGHLALSRGFPGQLLSPGRVLAKDESGTWAFPNTPDLEFAAGEWSLELGAFVVERAADEWVRTPATGALAAGVLVSAPPGEDPPTVSVPLVVYLASEDVTAAEAAEHPVLGPALARLRSALAPAGLSLAEPAFVDVEDPSLRTLLLEDDVCTGGDLDELVASTAGRPAGELALFVVDRFQCVIAGGLDVGQQIGGLTAGLPGSGPLPGTRESGVAVSLAFAEEEPELLGTVAAHEFGHYLGLFHTRERPRFDAPDVFDIIADTPEEQPGVAENLMYFVAQENASLTAGQRAVLQASPLVQAAAAGEGL